MENDLKKRLALKFSQEMQTESRISNFKLKGDLVRKIYIWVGGVWGTFRIICLKGDFSTGPVLRPVDFSFYSL